MKIPRVTVKKVIDKHTEIKQQQTINTGIKRQTYGNFGKFNVMLALISSPNVT